MFNSKKIKELEEKILERIYRVESNHYASEYKLTEENIVLKNRLAKLENPSKYKIGDKAKGGIVCNVYFEPANRWNCRHTYTVSFVNAKTKKIEQFTETI